jgi:hypothetical protein
MGNYHLEMRPAGRYFSASCGIFAVEICEDLYKGIKNRFFHWHADQTFVERILETTNVELPSLKL